VARVATQFVVRSGGLQTTVQDRGRFGSRRLGVPLSGALDPYALRIANLLVGNHGDAAVLECTLRGPVIAFENETLVALCGGDFAADLDGVQVAGWRPIHVEAGSVLTIGNAHRGLRCCVAIAGGIDTVPVLGSRSTFVRANLGGYEGRALASGDVVPLGRPGADALTRIQQLRNKAARWFVDVRDVYGAEFAAPRLRAYAGAHAQLMRGYVDAFFETEFTVAPASDRMGYRLSGKLPAAEAPGGLVSEPVVPGTVQQPPGSQAIVLLADAQTTGGYARVAHVAQVDLPRLAQASPGARVRFEQITREQAVQLLRKREQDLARLSEAVRYKFI